MRGGESGTSVIQARVPELKIVSFRVVQRWPPSSPATSSPDLPEYEFPPPPAFLSPGAKQLYQQGIDYLHSQECHLYHSELKPEDWLAAYGATVVPNFTEQILGALLHSSVLDEFASEIVEPLANRHDTTHVYNYLHRTLSAQQVDWTIFVPRHRTVVDPTPPEDDLVRVLPRDEFPSSGGWIDNIAEKIDHLVSLLTQADDLPRSRTGWIHLSALKRYDGPAVPGNQNPHTNTIIHNRTFALSRSGSSIPLDDAALYNMVAFDNRRRKFRLTLGEHQGPTKKQLVLASYINASTDIGEVVDWIKSKFLVAQEGDLEVLHNCNKMVNAFATTEWVAGSKGAVISRSVTSCAGMTAYLVLLAQTRVGFLSGGRGKSFRQLAPQEQTAQREEAFARATVALTRAQQICLIMSPLDMLGLVGAATIMGCLKYGASFSGFDDQDDPVLLFRLKDEDLLEAPDDSAFFQSLRFSCARE